MYERLCRGNTRSACLTARRKGDKYIENSVRKRLRQVRQVQLRLAGQVPEDRFLDHDRHQWVARAELVLAVVVEQGLERGEQCLGVARELGASAPRVLDPCPEHLPLRGLVAAH